MLLRLFLAAWVSFAYLPGAGAGEAYARMSQRDAATQREILGIEIRSSGNRCSKVLWSMYLGEFRNRDAYSAQCNDGFDYLVTMQYRGSLFGGVRLCQTSRYQLGINCWRPIRPSRN
jgi:hypothetical protein